MATRTSATDPIRVDWIATPELGSCGRLGVTIAPGIVDAQASWKRDLRGDVRRLRDVHDVDVLVTTLPREELQSHGIDGIGDVARDSRMRWISFPIPRGGLPVPPVGEDQLSVERVVADLVLALQLGDTVVVHGRAHGGRAGLVVGCVLRALGRSAAEAVERAYTPSGLSTDAEGQEAYVRTGFLGVTAHFPLYRFPSFRSVFDQDLYTWPVQRDALRLIRKTVENSPRPYEEVVGLLSVPNTWRPATVGAAAFMMLRPGLRNMSLLWRYIDESSDRPTNVASACVVGTACLCDPQFELEAARRLLVCLAPDDAARSARELGVGPPPDFRPTTDWVRNLALALQHQPRPHGASIDALLASNRVRDAVAVGPSEPDEDWVVRWIREGNAQRYLA